MALAFSDKNPVLVDKDTPLLETTRKMTSRGKYHAFLTTGEGRLWGVLSIRDIAKALFVHGEEGMELVELAKLGGILKSPSHLYAAHPPIASPHDISFEEAISIMVGKNIGSLPLVDNKGRVLGALDERYLIKSIPDYTDLRACDIASWSPVGTEPDALLEEAVGLMLSMNIRRLVVRDSQGATVGLVSLPLIIKYLTSEENIEKMLKGSREPVEKPVGDLSLKPWVVDCSYTLKEIASIMYFEPTGAVLVSDNGKEGIITERDMMIALEEELNK